MMMARVGTGRCAMSTERRHLRLWRSLASGAALVVLPVLAAEAPEPPAPAQASYQVLQPEGLAARLLGERASPVRELDPAIFTELSPVTASEPALRLPEDQQDDH